MGFHPANFGLPRPFRSQVRSRHATDRRTDIAHHFIMHTTYGGRVGIISKNRNETPNYKLTDSATETISEDGFAKLVSDWYNRMQKTVWNQNWFPLDFINHYALTLRQNVKLLIIMQWPNALVCTASTKVEWKLVQITTIEAAHTSAAVSHRGHNF